MSTNYDRLDWIWGLLGRPMSKRSVWMPRLRRGWCVVYREIKCTVYLQFTLLVPSHTVGYVFCVLCAWGALLNSCSWFAWGIWRLSSSPTLLLPNQNGNWYPHRISRHRASAKHFSRRGTFLMSSSPKFLRLWTHYQLWRQVTVLYSFMCRFK